MGRAVDEVNLGDAGPRFRGAAAHLEPLEHLDRTLQQLDAVVEPSEQRARATELKGRGGVIAAVPHRVQRPHSRDEKLLGFLQASLGSAQLSLVHPREGGDRDVAGLQ